MSANRVIDLSVRTAKLLGFYGNGLAKVKVEYVGRAPLAGSDDRKLEATLREPGMAAPAVQVASNKGYAPTYFDSRPLTRMSAEVPAPPERPYRLGEGARDVPAVPTHTVEVRRRSSTGRAALRASRACCGRTGGFGSFRLCPGGL